MEIKDDEFPSLWQGITEVLVRIAGQISNVKKHEWQKAVDAFLKDPLTAEDERNAQELLRWYDNDTEVKQSLEKLKTLTQEGMERLERSLNDFQEELEGKAHVIEEKGQFLENTVQEEAKCIKDQLKSATQSVQCLVREEAQEIKGQLGGELKTTTQNVQSLVRDEIQDIRGELNKATQNVQCLVLEEAQDLKGELKSTTQNVQSVVREEAQDLKGELKSTTQNVQSVVREEAQDIKEKLDEVHQSIDGLRSTAGSSQAAGEEAMSTAKTMICDWLKFMLSIPRTEPMTNTQKFTQGSSAIAYCIGGGTLLVGPQLWRVIFQLHFLGRTEGYLRLIGLGVVIIGLLLIIAARSSQQGPILGSILARCVFVNTVLGMLAIRSMMPLSFALFFMGLDTSLALITLVIWCRETERASMSLFFHETLSPIFKCHGVTSGRSVAAVFLVGLFQFFFWLVFAVTPDAAQSVLHLDNFQGHSDGFLAGVFFTLSIHGWRHVTDASAVSKPFVQAALCYRMFLNIPVFLILGLVDQIERNLCIALLGFELCSFIVILVFAISFSKKDVPATEGNEQTLLTPGDNE